MSLRNLWSGNIFLKSNDLTSHSVALVDWTHAEIGKLYSSHCSQSLTVCLQLLSLLT